MQITLVFCYLWSGADLRTDCCFYGNLFVILEIYLVEHKESLVEYPASCCEESEGILRPISLRVKRLKDNKIFSIAIKSYEHFKMLYFCPFKTNKRDLQPSCKNIIY